jgi:hypothetical protein
VNAETEERETVFADVKLNHADNSSLEYANQAPQLRSDSGSTLESEIGRSVHLSKRGGSQAVNFSYFGFVFRSDFAHRQRMHGPDRQQCSLRFSPPNARLEPRTAAT